MKTLYFANTLKNWEAVYQVFTDFSSSKEVNGILHIYCESFDKRGRFLSGAYHPECTLFDTFNDAQKYINNKITN